MKKTGRYLLGSLMILSCTFLIGMTVSKLAGGLPTTAVTECHTSYPADLPAWQWVLLFLTATYTASYMVYLSLERFTS